MRFLGESPRLHSKQFQFYAIMDRAFGVKLSNNSDAPPLRAIGFGVGKEPIPSALVSLGFRVIATDYMDGEHADAWKSTGQQSQAVLDLNQRKLVSDDAFLSACEFVNMDMNQIPTSLDESFDFVWSSCALGHIGSYNKGLDFVLRSLRLLKPGGWAVHSTEIDRSDLVDKFESPGLSFYKLYDLEELLNTAEKLGFKPLKIKKASFSGASEKYIVSEPWGKKPHLRIEIFGREINSVVIQIQRPL
jgi:SAM-dependent methyltransferase